jgi:hypothetical protein
MPSIVAEGEIIAEESFQVPASPDGTDNSLSVLRSNKRLLRQVASLYGVTRARQNLLCLRHPDNELSGPPHAVRVEFISSRTKRGI